MESSRVLRSDFRIEDFVGDIPNMTVPEYLLQCTDENVIQGRKKFIVDTVSGRQHNYSEVAELTKRIGSYLYKRGMRKGDTLIYLTYDMVHLHLIFIGVWRANGMVRASYPEDDEETLLDRVRESRAGWLLCEPQTAATCLSVASQVYWDVDVITIGDVAECTSIYELFADDGSELPRNKLGMDDFAMILCTSGTTGKSKGAVHSHRSLLHTIVSMPFFMPFTEDKPSLLASKGTHISGSIFPLGCLAVGRTCLVMAKINKENLFNAISKYKPGLVFGFPTFLLQLINDSDAGQHDFGCVEWMVSGGAPITPTIESTLMKLPRMKALFIIYGLTEYCPITSGYDVTKHKPAKYKEMPPSSIGRLCPGIELQIRDVDTGKILGCNQQGEICVRGKNIFREYYKNQDATVSAFTDGWFLTGDVGYYDKAGFLFLVDRIKEIFKYYNNHISPTELEDVISMHEMVDQVCVVGVEDPEGGDRIPRAFVTLKDSRRDDHAQIGLEIQEYANGKLVDYKHLRGGVYILAELLKGKTGKVSRLLLQELNVSSINPR